MSAGGEGDNCYGLVEEKSFDEAVTALGGAQCLGAALAAFAGSLARNPRGFPLIPGWANVRLAKTKAITVGEVAIPPLRLWFTVGTGREPEGEDDGCVYLIYIERMGEEDPWTDE